MKLRLIVSTRFQVLFHSPSGVLFTFPSRYWFTIGRQGVFSLGRWSSRIPTGFHVSRSTRGPFRREVGFSYRAVTLCGGPFQVTSPTRFFYNSMWNAPQPRRQDRLRFGLVPVRSPLLRESRLLSLPRGTKMFQFPRSASNRPIDSGGGAIPLQDGGLPHSEIPGSQPAYGSPRQYRCSPRPSSAPGAKASSVCSFLLFLNYSSGRLLPLTTFPYPIFKVQAATMKVR